MGWRHPTHLWVVTRQSPPVAVEPPSGSEAWEWLGRPAQIGGEGATLAELSAMRGELRTVREDEQTAVGGQYL